MEIVCVVICINVVVIMKGMRSSYCGIIVVLSNNNVVVYHHRLPSWEYLEADVVYNL
jgi:hypothetical protein